MQPGRQVVAGVCQWAFDDAGGQSVTDPGLDHPGGVAELGFDAIRLESADGDAHQRVRVRVEAQPDADLEQRGAEFAEPGGQAQGHHPHRAGSDLDADDFRVGHDPTIHHAP